MNLSSVAAVIGPGAFSLKLPLGSWALRERLKREPPKVLAVDLVALRVCDRQNLVAVSLQILYLLSRLMRVRLLDRGLLLSSAKSIFDLVSHYFYPFQAT
jgi:hypothetical protein